MAGTSAGLKPRERGHRHGTAAPIAAWSSAPLRQRHGRTTCRRINHGVPLVPERCRAALRAFGNRESLTVVVASGATRETAAAALQADLNDPVAAGIWDRATTFWGFLELPGGVLAVEQSGYGDPSRFALQALSDGGQTSAVVRTNIQAHVRFGCARHGELVFDDDEYRYALNDLDTVPAELRSLFELADSEDCFLVGLAMVERFSGLEVTAQHVNDVLGPPFFAAPNLLDINDPFD